MLIGRELETKELRDIYNSDESSFVAIYGRRRIGKTYLINELFEHDFTFRHAGIYKGTKPEQLYAFSASLKEFGYKITEKINNWYEAFENLKDLIKNSDQKKKIIFFDEIAWMYTKGSNFIKALENFWNGWACARKDIMLIICSSATSWIINNIIHSKGGLYNRITAQIHLQPFTLQECEKYSEYKNLALTKKQITEVYMIIGGVPYYWTLFKKGQSVPQFIDSCFFKNGSPLSGEFKYIFSSLFTQPNDYIKIVEVLSCKKYGMTRNEILEETQLIDNGEFSNKLEDLINCGFIRGYSPMIVKKKSIIYQLIDPFTIFHFHFLTKNINDDNYWSNMLNTPTINTWQGLAFERICILHTNSIKKSLGISGVHTAVYPWSCKKDLTKQIYGSQIDMVIERKDDIVNIIEIKYYDAPYIITQKYMENLSKKKHDYASITKTKSAIHFTFIALNGIENNTYSKEIQSVINIEDLFV